MSAVGLASADPLNKIRTKVSRTNVPKSYILMPRKESKTREAAMDVFDCGAVLFDSGVEEERLHVACTVNANGELCIVRQSEGPVTSWSFSETPHRVELRLDAAGLRTMMEYFHLDAPTQVPAVLRLEYADCDCFQRIQELCERLGLAEHMQEIPQS